jgi:hypothetical protein
MLLPEHFCSNSVKVSGCNTPLILMESNVGIVVGQVVKDNLMCDAQVEPLLPLFLVNKLGQIACEKPTEVKIRKFALSKRRFIFL